MVLLFIILTFLISASLSAITLHPGTTLLCSLIGQNKCVSSDGLNGCNWWPTSVLVSTALCLVLWKPYGWIGLTGTVAGPVLSILLATASLRFGKRAFRKKEFEIQSDKVFDLRNSQPLSPEYVVAEGAYYQTGPATGYCLYCIVLKDSNVTLASNKYVNDLDYERDRHHLIFEQNLPTLSVSFFYEEGEVFKSVTLGSQWNDLVFSRNAKIPSDSLAWWRHFAAPNLGEKDVVNVDTDALRENISVVYHTLGPLGLKPSNTKPANIFGPQGDGPFARIGSDLLGLEHLVSISGGKLKAVNHEYQSEHIMSVWGKDYPTENRIEDGVWVTKPWKEDS